MNHERVNVNARLMRTHKRRKHIQYICTYAVHNGAARTSAYYVLYVCLCPGTGGTAEPNDFHIDPRSRTCCCVAIHFFGFVDTFSGFRFNGLLCQLKSYDYVIKTSSSLKPFRFSQAFRSKHNIESETERRTHKKCARCPMRPIRLSVCVCVSVAQWQPPRA